jgi:hypothetical protein
MGEILSQVVIPYAFFAMVLNLATREASVHIRAARGCVQPCGSGG